MSFPARIRLSAAAAAAVAALADCGTAGSQAPAAPPRPGYPAGPVYAPAARYLAAHPQHIRTGVIYGILVRAASPSWASQQLNGGAWTGAVVIPGGRIEHVSSGPGDNGMASLAAVGDAITFPASGPVDAPSDDGDGTPARVLVAGAVNVP